MNTRKTSRGPTNQNQIEAAEYVLCTMTAPQRHTFEQRIETDRALKAAVAAWSNRFETLLANTPEVEPSRQVFDGLQAMLDNAPQPGSETIRHKEGDWQQLFDGVFKKSLVVDLSAETESYLLRIDPGALVPAHGHGKTEECFVVEGDMIIGTASFEKGDYHAIPANVPHLPITSSNGGILFIRGEIRTPPAT